MATIDELTVQEANVLSQTDANKRTTSGAISNRLNTLVLQGENDAETGTAKFTIEVTTDGSGSVLDNLLGQSSGDDRYKITVEKVPA